jgi:hypothetical protein
MMNMLLRNRLGGVMQVAGISPEEVNNFMFFCDGQSLGGITKAALFAFGVAGGGKRARSTAGILLEHCTVEAQEVRLKDGTTMLVPAVRMKIVDEKFADYQGLRETGEKLSGVEDYDEWASRSFSYWVYRMLVWRGAFEGGDPFLFGDVEKGAVVPFIHEARGSCSAKCAGVTGT